MRYCINSSLDLELNIQHHCHSKAFDTLDLYSLFSNYKSEYYLAFVAQPFNGLGASFQNMSRLSSLKINVLLDSTNQMWCSTRLRNESR